MNLNNIIYYVSGFLFVLNFIFLLKFTNISIHILDIFGFKSYEKEIFSTDDLENYLCIKYSYLGELFSCPICLSTHVSWVTGLFLYLFFDFSPWLILLATFSWPSLVFIVYSKVKS